MRCAVERHGCLHGWNDRQPWRRELCSQFLDTKPKSGIEQRANRQWASLDCNRRLFELHNYAKCSDWIGVFRNNQLQHKLGLDSGLRSSWL